MPAVMLHASVLSLQKSLVPEFQFQSCPGDCSGNEVEVKEAEACFSTATAPERDFQGQSGEKGPLRKNKSNPKA